MNRILIAIAALAACLPLHAQITIGPWYLGVPHGFAHSATGIAGLQLNADGEKVAFVFTVPKSGTIEAIGIKNNNASTPDELSVTLQTVGTDSKPTGTLYGGSAEGIITTPASVTTHEATLGTPATAVAGNTVAVVIEFDSFASGNISIAVLGSNGNTTFPITWHDSGAGYAASNNTPMVYLKYDDDSICIPLGCLPPCNMSVANLQADNNPDEVGFQFTAPVACRLIGVSFMPAPSGTTESVSVSLFNSSGSTLLTNATTTFQSSYANAGGLRRSAVVNLEPESLTASQVVTVGIFTTDTTNNFAIGYLDVSDASHWGDFMPNITWASRERNNDSTPTNSFTALSTRKPLGGIWIDQVTTDGSSVLLDPIIIP